MREYEYKIGNGYGGYFYFKTSSVQQQAWEHGCSIFNNAYPKAMTSEKGDLVYMFIFKSFPIWRTDRSIPEQAFEYVPIIYGYSKEKLIRENGA